MTEGIYTEVELRAARDLVRHLIRVVRSHRLYEGDHPTLGQLQAKLRRTWDSATAGGPISLQLTARKVLLADETVYQGSGAAGEVVPTALYEHGVVGFVFRRGLEPDEARRLVGVLATEPDSSVDYASLLWEADLKHVQVLLDHADEEQVSVASPERFAEEVEELGDEHDVPAGADYETERGEAERGEAEEDFDAGTDTLALTEAERSHVRGLLEADSYMATVRHALGVAHSMARVEATPDEAASLERALRSLTGTVVASGDLASATEVLSRAHAMISSDRPLEMRAGELTLQLFRAREGLATFFRRLDDADYVDTRGLGELLALLGAEAAAATGGWLLETRHPTVVADAMRVFREAAVEVLVPLYRTGGARGRERAGPALLEIGTPEALLALAAEFPELPRATRLKLLHLIAREKDPDLRRVVLAALDDPAEPVRRAAVGAVRKQDAPALGPVLLDFFERGVFEARYREETEDFFEMLSRVGDRAVAMILADRCLPKGLRLGFRRLTPIQQLCARALRRMRAPDARPVVEELRRKGPRAVREILESPLGDL